tara:strand:+ start:888 stop:1043 length:156 start_codon:yes stop_codon:yes gene_type:complete
MRFKIYQKGSIGKDIIMKFESFNMQTAIEHASQVKKLNKEIFLKLFVVVCY